MKGIKEFIANAESDVQLQNELKKVKSLEAFITCAKNAGYNISAQELTSAFSVQNKSGELSDEQMEKVVGGSGLRTIVGKIWGTVCGSSDGGGGTGATGVRG